MSDVVEGVFGPSDAEKAQMRRLREQKRRQDAVEAGQAALRSGGRGLLAFVDDEMGTSLGGGGGRRTRRRGALTEAARTMGGAS
ncbi:MAG: hypothetical protein ACLFPA_12720 [Dichotomicrobium sp.]